MKKLIILTIIAIVLIAMTSCTSRSGKRAQIIKELAKQEHLQPLILDSLNTSYPSEYKVDSLITIVFLKSEYRGEDTIKYFIKDSGRTCKYCFTYHSSHKSVEGMRDYLMYRHTPHRIHNEVAFKY